MWGTSAPVLCTTTTRSFSGVQVLIMAEDKTRFTFSFFDAAHTDGYVAPEVSSNKKLKGSRSENQVASRQGGGFFLDDDEEEEDIVKKIHHWQQNSGKDSNAKHRVNHRELRELFSEPAKEEQSQREMDNNDHPGSEDIHLNRLLDDYMLGEQGDRIMRQMEDMTTDDSPSPVRDAAYNKDLFGDNQKQDQEPSLDLDAMLSMEDFEKYIAEN